MAAIPILADSGFWSSKLGLFGVPLLEGRLERVAFLNGSFGNFCLEVEQPQDQLGERDLAWSADLGHYVRLGEHDVEVIRWDLEDRTRTPIREVRSDPAAFYAQLESNQPRRDVAIVPHFISVFRSLRTSLGANVAGHEALGAFLYLLANAADHAEDRSFDAGRWQLPEDAQAIASKAPRGEWEVLVEALTRPRSADNLRPLPDVVLRHAAGLLFQEAHYEAVVFDQRQLSLYPVLPPQARLGTRERTSVGVYFTPPAIARTLCEEARRHVPSNARSLTIFDPACGSGEFLREALRQLRLAEFTGDIRVLGWDISAAAVSMARFALNWETRMLTGKATATIEQRDSLDQRPWPASDIVLMNPPFVSWLDLPKDRAQQLKALLDGLTSHRPDLASVFLWRGIQSLTPQGVLGAVLPASLLDGESVRDLRHAVAERAIPTLIAKLGSHHLFHGAAVDTALFVAAKQPQTDPALVWADYRSSSSSAALRSLRRYRAMAPPSIPIEGLGFSVYGTQPIAGVDKWVPRPYQSWRRLQQVSASTVVGDLFAVRQGVLTGLNKVFVLPRATFFQLPEAERAFFRPATTNASIDVGRIVENAYVFYPYTEGGILRVATLATVRRHLPFYYREFIKPNEARLKARSLLDRQWWEPLKPRLTWQPPLVPRLLSVYFGGPGCFAFDESGRFACVQGYAWSWRRAPSLPIALGYAYSALLASSIVGDLLGMVSSHTGGGQWNLSRRFLTDMPLPDLAQTAHEVVSGLTQVGRSLATGQPVPQKGIDELAAVAYGVVST